MSAKKLILFTSCLMLSALSITGCGSETSATAGNQSETVSENISDDNSEKSLKVVCTIFPEYDWVKQILGDKAESADITYLLDKGIDLHSFQPTADDIMKISACDLFVYVGGESDKWVEDTLDEAVNKDMKVINLMEVLGDSAKVEEIKEGMQGEEEEEGEESEDEEEYDEHVWLSVKNAEILCSEIEDVLSGIDPENAGEYKANLDSYISQLDTLDDDFMELFDSSSVKTLVFGDRFPFRYFTDDYGLDYYAAFVGCSAETEASFETIAFLADKVNELDCNTLFTLENSDKSIANTIISTSGRNIGITELNSLQSVSRDDIKNGATYISLMQKNYDVLKKVLN